MKINNVISYVNNCLYGYKRLPAGQNKQGEKLYKWVKQTASGENKSLIVKTKLPSGTLIHSEYEVTQNLNIGKLLLKEILKPDKTQIRSSKLTDSVDSVYIKKGNTVNAVYFNDTIDSLPKTFKFTINQDTSVICIENFKSLLKLK